MRLVQVSSYITTASLLTTQTAKLNLHSTPLFSGYLSDEMMETVLKMKLLILPMIKASYFLKLSLTRIYILARKKL